MRFGIVVPHQGPLAAAPAVEATARAAAELGYASLWSGSVEVLRAAGAAAQDLPLGLLLAGPTDARVEGLSFVAAPGVDRRTAACAPRALLLEAGPVAPRPGAADGWFPRGDLLPLQRPGRQPGLLVVRLHRPPAAQDLRRAAALGAAEVVVALRATTLDEQLAGFAAAADAVAGHASNRVASRTIRAAKP